MLNNNQYLKSNIEGISKNVSKKEAEFNKNNLDNAKKENTFFGDNYFTGINTFSLSQMSAGEFSLIMNAIPQFNKITSAWGYESIGKHKPFFQNKITEYRVIHIGEIYSRQYIGSIFGENIKIVKHKTTGETIIFKLNDKEEWEDISPTDSDGNKYNFISDSFSDTNWKNSFYLVSGKEQFTTKQIQKTKNDKGEITGNEEIEVSGNVLKYSEKGINKTSWSAIKTGAAGYLESIFTNVSIYDQDGKVIKEKLNFNDQAIQFNPSLILARKGRSYIAGSDSNDVQVKVSEFDNLDNFTDNILQGVNSAILTASDSQRSSTFIATMQNDRITCLIDYNNKTIIGTELGFYEHDLVQSKTIAGEFTLYDQINKVSFAECGPYNNRTQAKYSGSIIFLGKINGRISFCEIQSKTSGNGSYYQFSNRGAKIQKVLDNIDIDNCVITQKEDYFIISTRYLSCEDEQKSIQICGYQYSDKGITNYNFFLLDYINASRIFSSQFGVFFSNEESGEVYKITNIKDPIIESNKIISKPKATLVSGLTGYEKNKNLFIQTKTITGINISGSMDQKTSLEVNIFDYKNDTPIFAYNNQNKRQEVLSLESKDFISGKRYDNNDNLSQFKYTNSDMKNYFEINENKNYKSLEKNSYKACYYNLEIENYGNYFELYKCVIYALISNVKNKT